VSRQDLSRLVDDGILAVADQPARVCRLTGVPEDPDLDRLRVAWLQLGGAKSWHECTAAPDVVISHRSAAHLRGLGDLIPHEHEFTPPPGCVLDAATSNCAYVRRSPWGVGRSGAGRRCTVPALIGDLHSDHEDESAVAQIALDAPERVPPVQRRARGSHRAARGSLRSPEPRCGSSGTRHRGSVVPGPSSGTRHPRRSGSTQRPPRADRSYGSTPLSRRTPAPVRLRPRHPPAVPLR
jgi:hypothetical protein